MSELSGEDDGRSPTNSDDERASRDRPGSQPDPSPDRSGRLLGEWDRADRERARWGLVLVMLLVAPLFGAQPVSGFGVAVYGVAVFFCIVNVGFPGTVLGLSRTPRRVLLLLPLFATILLVVELPGTVVGLLALLAIGWLSRGIATRN